MNLTPEQRNAAIAAIATVMLRAYDREFDGGHLTAANFTDDAEEVLDALLEAFVVLPRDDVTLVYGTRTSGGDYIWDVPAREPGDVTVARFVTRWQPITDTKEQT